mmetsp:Transcript_1606/g.3459  ORF Transcript_1606/g.3459 Transcript_1606/m.3459 type:complete len:321 (+) Transcript_1606:521-1483(+)
MNRMVSVNLTRLFAFSSFLNIIEIIIAIIFFTCIVKEVVSTLLLFLILLRTMLVDSRAEVDRITTEGDFQTLEELIHSCQERLRRRRGGFDSGSSVVNNDTICQICCHDEIVLYHKCRFLAVHDEAFDDLGTIDTLFRIKVGTGFIDKIDIGRFTQRKRDSETLQFSPGQRLHSVIDDRFNCQRLHDIRNELRVDVCISDALVKELTSCSFEFRRNLLRFVANVQIGDTSLRGLVIVSILLEFLLLVTLLQTSEHSDEGSLSSTILSQQNDDFGISEFATINVQDEFFLSSSLGSRHRWITIRLHQIFFSVCLGTFGDLE